MRVRILRELSAVQEANEALAAHAADLQRSNAELEQFAYVASHDLQEPLRKVTSFCQLLQRRYGGQLDERADQYIEFAVDGAKRMQVLINDLLAFSRVGRSAAGARPGRLRRGARRRRRRTCPTRSTQAGAVDRAPGRCRWCGRSSRCMTVVFQNLLGNALKFRGEQPPRIGVTAERDGAFWSFSVADNGIGIEPQYADRVFLIFQRLHDRAAYPGTGHRPGDVPEDHRVLRRPDLARHRRRGRRQVLLHRCPHFTDERGDRWLTRMTSSRSTCSWWRTTRATSS